MSDSLKVVFRKETGGEIVAVFPVVGNSLGHLRIYAHIGQHGAGSPEWYHTTRPASPEEYESLLRELRGIYEGDDEPITLVPSKRLPPRHQWL